MSFTSVETPRWRDVYVAAGARGISVCGDFLAATALALSFQSSGAGGMAVAGLLLAATLPLVVFAPLAGRLADRIDSRRLLVTAGFGQAAVCAALAFVGHPLAATVLVAVLATGLAVTQPTLAALLPDMVGRRHLPRASAVNQTAGAVGALVAPALAGLLVGSFGVRLPLLLDAATYLAIVAAGLLLRTRRGGAVTAGGAETRQPAAAPHRGAGWRLRHDSLLRTTLISIAAVVGAVSAINVVAVFFVRETLGASTTTYGIVEAAWTAGMLGGAWLLAGVARRARDDGALVTGVLIQLGGASAVIAIGALIYAPLWLVPLWLVGGVFNGGLNVFDNLLMVSRVPPAYRGRAFSALGAVINGAAMGGFFAGGVLLLYAEPRPLVAALGIAGLAIVAGLAAPVLRTIRRERAAAERAKAAESSPGAAGPSPDAAVPADTVPQAA